MTILLLLFWIAACFVMLRCCKVLNSRAEQKQEEEQRDPCATCLRWEECAGVDDDCPLRQE